MKQPLFKMQTLMVSMLLLLLALSTTSCTDCDDPDPAIRMPAMNPS